MTAAAMCLQPISAAAAACGSQNRRVARGIDEFRSSSLFAIAIEASTKDESTLDEGGRPMRFIGNAFLIEKNSEIPLSTAYFATARHNVAAACRAAPVGEAPKIRLVMRNLASYAVESVDSAKCDELRAIEEAAGDEDVIFMPDVEILRAKLPSGVGKPAMVGGREARFDVGNGNVERMSKSFVPTSTASVGLPDTPWQKPEHRKFSNILAIQGNNLGGTSGSPYVVVSDGVPVVLGIVTNSIPPEGAPMRGGDFTLTASETSDLFASQFPLIASQGYSLIFRPEALGDIFDTRGLDESISAPFHHARSKNLGEALTLVDDLAARFDGSGLSAAVYIKRQCQKRPETYKDAVVLSLFCTELIGQTEAYQCFLNAKAYRNQTISWLEGAASEGGPDKESVVQVVSAIDDARTALGQALRKGTAEDIAPLISSVMRIAIKRSPDAAAQAGRNWTSGMLFDLAKAEKLSGVDAEDYLARLTESFGANPTNFNAKKAFVDGAAREGIAGEAQRSLELLGELEAARFIPKLEASQTRATLKRLLRF